VVPSDKESFFFFPRTKQLPEKISHSLSSPQQQILMNSSLKSKKQAKISFTFYSVGPFRSGRFELRDLLLLFG
jgi:hypothetical protein